ncbi:MFS transporter [Paraburkholderia sp. Ac-20340]|uniref:MFS transporter n=1 Tax=Paraburkholderia sp. Ac-20340 TaxID=2703888 RepID=UPI00197E5EA0|nr:MFS transporter [Paraburkholderia sp. Ac-20340]MBN3854750.1 MFS transporter [Paraburkholderia sp. Ac-20340]
MNDTAFSSAPHSAEATNAPRTRGQFRLIAACSLGNALEIFDFTIYSFFALLIGKLFFPSSNPYISLLLSVATFGIGFAMRPLGGFVIGNYADRRGRKAALTLTLSLMVAGTLCIAVAPSYASAGVLGTLMVLAGRLLQGFSVGGEFAAAAVLLMESGHQQGRGWRVSWTLATQGIASVVGALCAAALHAALPTAALESWGWRLPFLIGLLIAPVGIYIRSHLDETHQPREQGPSPLRMLWRDHRGLVIKGIMATAAGTATMYLVVFFMPTYMIRVLHLPPALSLLSGCVTGATVTVAALVSGRLTDRLARRKPLVLTSLTLSMLAVYPAFWLITTYPSVPLVICLATLLTACINLGMTPLFLGIMETLPIEVRTSGISVISSVGIAVIGGSSQFIVTWLLARTGNPMSPAWYMLVCCVVTVLAVMSIRETPRREGAR